jgi:Na+/melibiose symporter-like transporter
MNEQKLEAWRKKRQMGKKKYVLVYGTIVWGIVLTLLFTLLEYVSQETFLWGWVAARFIVFGMIGFFIANNKWLKAERALNIHEQNQSGTH